MSNPRAITAAALTVLFLAGCTAAPAPAPTESPEPEPTHYVPLETTEAPTAAPQGTPQPTAAASADLTACLDAPAVLTEWLGEHSWEYSKTRPAGAARMVAAGGGWYVAAVKTTGAFKVKAWAWTPTRQGNIAQIMPLPDNWDEIKTGGPDDAEYYKATLPIVDGAHTAAVKCLKG